MAGSSGVPRPIAGRDRPGARDAFSAVLAAAEVPEAFFGLATALFWLGDLVGTIANCEHAYAGLPPPPDPMFAAGAALALVGYNKGYLGNTAAARGWLSRAARIIENGTGSGAARRAPRRCHGLRHGRSGGERGAGAPGGRDRRANGNADLQLMAMMHRAGQALRGQQGKTEEGMSLLDEAECPASSVAKATTRHGRPSTVELMTIRSCAAAVSISKPATQWVRSLERFIDRYGCPFLYAECRTYYGRVLFENGDWPAAEALLTEAISMSKGAYAAPHAFASGTLAELRLAQGRDEDAARVLRGVEGREEAAAARRLAAPEAG